MKRRIYILIVGFFALFCQAGCSAEPEDEMDLQGLAQIEVYDEDGGLINTIADEDVLHRFNGLKSISFWESAGTSERDGYLEDGEFSEDEDPLGDENARQEKLKEQAAGLHPLYKIISYKTPVSVFNDGNLEKEMEITVYEDSNIIKEQIAPETVKGADVPEEYLEFYIDLSKEDLEFLISLTH